MVGMHAVFESSNKMAWLAYVDKLDYQDLAYLLGNFFMVTPIWSGCTFLDFEIIHSAFFCFHSSESTLIIGLLTKTQSYLEEKLSDSSEALCYLFF